jgi:adenylylsulfate kinase
MKGYTIWFSGLHCSGKTTIATELVKELKKRDIPFVLLDDDKVRSILSPDLRDSNKYSYYRHVVRLANVSYIITMNNILSIVCTVSPARKLRGYARTLIKYFMEIQVRTPTEICESRMKSSGIPVDSFYEKGESPEIIVNSETESIEESVKRIIKYLEDKGII